jgi:hypothetical protein
MARASPTAVARERAWPSTSCYRSADSALENCQSTACPVEQWQDMSKEEPLREGLIGACSWNAVGDHKVASFWLDRRKCGVATASHRGAPPSHLERRARRGRGQRDPASEPESVVPVHPADRHPGLASGRIRTYNPPVNSSTLELRGTAARTAGTDGETSSAEDAPKEFDLVTRGLHATWARNRSGGNLLK